VRYLLGYTSALEALARGAGALAKPPLEVVITNAEGVLDHQRRTIEAGLGCAVRETYGMAEAVAAASECPSGALHLWPDAGVVEVLNRDGNGPGELVATGLVNEDMPLIRYRVGDRVTPGTAQAACACGRSLPQLRSVEGRCDDVLYTADGRAVGRLDPVFKAAGSVREAQIVQETLDRVRVLLVPAPSFQAAHGKAIADAIRRRMGPVDVVVDQVAEIPRSRNGKFRAVVSRLTPEERRALQAQLR
jgi:phenylacetate-CoA ligase